MSAPDNVDPPPARGFRDQSPSRRTPLRLLAGLIVALPVLTFALTRVSGCSADQPGVSPAATAVVDTEPPTPAPAASPAASPSTGRPAALDTASGGIARGEATPALSQAPVFDLAPPVELPAAPSLRAAGPAPPGQLPHDVREALRPNSVSGTAAAAAGIGVGTIYFFGVSDKATRVVYVVDCSGSMGGPPLSAAKSELIASLQGLDPHQQFQIVFYNHGMIEMTLPNDPAARLFFATDANRRRAREFIEGIVADGGTEHLPPLKKGLRLNPEVLFFLTDRDTGMSLQELESIDRLNQERTHIHVIEFGDGPAPAADNFLKRLAAQNAGQYRYRDVRQFRRP